MPRSYALGKRAVQQAETRRRIIDAALDLYQEQGISATTMQDVARRADVAPGTVANHFGSADALATEATVGILTDLRMPTVELFTGVDDPAARIGLLVREMGAFFRRSETWYWVSRREPPGVHAWAEAEARFYGDTRALVRAALGPLAGDAEAVAVVTAILTTWVLGAIEATGLSAGTAEDLVSDLLATWLASRAAGSDPLPGPA